VAEAQADAETALHIGVAESDAWLEASAQQWLGVLESRRGRDAEAHARFTSARKRFASAGYAWREARVLGNMATAALNAGRVDEAHELYGEALAAFRRLADRNGIAATLAQMAHLLHDVGQLTKAEETFAEMLLLSRDLQLSMRGTAFGCMASLFHELGKLDEARHWYEQALALVHSFGHRRNECLFTAARGAVLASQDKLIEAGDAFDRATILLEGESDELGAVVRLHRGHVDLARSRACATEGDTRASSRYRDQADARLREDAGDATDDLRFATRLLRRSLAAPRASSVPALVVAPDGRWFQPDGEKRVDISRRKQLVRLLRALVRQHVERPGETMSVAALVRAAWPGERFAVERSAAMRVYVQLSRLRRLGLNDALRTVGDGYVLDPSVIVAESTRRVQ